MVTCFQVSKDVAASHDTLVNIFQHIEYFFQWVEIHMKVSQTTTMTDIMVKIMVEVLSVFALATKEIKQGHVSKLSQSTVTNVILSHTEGVQLAFFPLENRLLSDIFDNRGYFFFTIYYNEKC